MHSFVEHFVCFPNWVRFAFFIESNIHPINKFAFALFRMMSVLEHTPIHVFGRSPIIYPVTGILGVPSFLLPIMTSVPCGVRFSWVYVPFSGLSQMFGWLISLTLIPVLDIHSSWVCYPYTGNISFLWCFLSEVFPVASPQESACVFPMDVLPLEFSFPQCESFTPQGGLQSDFCYPPNQSRVLFTLCQFCFSPP